MPDVDLDAARRARVQARKEHPSITLGGKKYRLVPELPLQATWAFALYTVAPTWNTLQEFLGYALANRADVDRVLAAGLTRPDLDKMLEAWNVTPGESVASNGSSKNGGKPSRPTSRTTTPAKRR